MSIGGVDQPFFSGVGFVEGDEKVLSLQFSSDSVCKGFVSIEEDTDIHATQFIVPDGGERVHGDQEQRRGMGFTLLDLLMNRLMIDPMVALDA